jgi:hypothetical protein
MRIMIDKLAEWKGLPILIGLVLVILNLALQFTPGLGVLAQGNVLLHLGIIVALGGFLLTEAL